MTLIHPSTFHEQQNCRTSEDILVYFQKRKEKKEQFTYGLKLFYITHRLKFFRNIFKNL